MKGEKRGKAVKWQPDTGTGKCSDSSNVRLPGKRRLASFLSLQQQRLTERG